MLDLLKQGANVTRTENGAITLKTTESDCLDLFATIGALRHANEDTIVSRFLRAYTENKDLAMKTLFFARDIRGGLGERRVFRVILKWLAYHEPSSVRKNLAYIAEYGRFDDLLVLLDTPCGEDAMALLKEQFEKDLMALREGGHVSLLAKWLPSINASSKTTVAYAKKLARYLGMRECEYRKALVALRAEISILENHLRERDYTFDYAKQPARAMFKYSQAFIRNDGIRYNNYLRMVRQGTAKLHTDTLSPYELIDPYLTFSWKGESLRPLTEEQKDFLNTTWAALPDFGGEEDALVVVDTSGSMYTDSTPKPASVALSLGLYFAERNTGAYHNHFIEFSATPQLIEIKGETFVDRLRYLSTFNEIANTNLEAVFHLILRTAIKNKVPANEMPPKLIIISDMEFDRCVCEADESNFENAKKRFAHFGYELPQIVFWNVASRNAHQPVRKNERGVTLVSGCTPRLFSMVASGWHDQPLRLYAGGA